MATFPNFKPVVVPASQVDRVLAYLNRNKKKPDEVSCSSVCKPESK